MSGFRSCRAFAKASSTNPECAGIIKGCAPNASQVPRACTSPMRFNSNRHQDIGYEVRQIENRLNMLTGQQDKKARNDKIAKDVGVVLLWPALFLLAGYDTKTERSQAKGKYAALKESARRKSCFSKQPAHWVRKPAVVGSLVMPHARTTHAVTHQE